MANMMKPPCDEAVLLSASSAAPCAKSAEPWILTATVLGSSMAFIDGTVVNVALPALQANLNATVADVQWVVESYALLLAALLLPGGSLGDRYGRKKIYAIGIGLFAAASMWCGSSSNVNQLIVARGVQGIGAALLVPGSLAIISSSFNQQRRGQAIATWSGFTSIAAALGPIVGGWMIEHYSWRSAFFINLPVAAVVLFIVLWRVPESRDPSRHSSLDWRGTTLATLGLGALVYGLIESSRFTFVHPIVQIALAIGVVLLVAFLFVERSISDPVLPLKIFRSRNFTGTNLLTLFLYAALNGALFFYPLNLIQIQGYSATAAGAAILPFLFMMFLLSWWSGGFVGRYGARLPLTIGPLIAGLGLALLAIPETKTNYWIHFFPAMTVLGAGMAISVAPLSTTVMNSVKQNEIGIASGINNAVSRIAGLLAIAIFGVVMLHAFHSRLQDRLASIDIDPKVQAEMESQKVRLAAIELPSNINEGTRNRIRHAIQDSFVGGFRVVLVFSALLAFASSFSAWLIIEPEP